MDRKPEPAQKHDQIVGVEQAAVFPVYSTPLMLTLKIHGYELAVVVI